MSARITSVTTLICLVGTFQIWRCILYTPNFRSPCINTNFDVSTCHTCRLTRNLTNHQITSPPPRLLAAFPFHRPGVWDFSDRPYAIGRPQPATLPPPIDSWPYRISSLTNTVADHSPVRRKLLLQVAVWFMDTMGAPPLFSVSGPRLSSFGHRCVTMETTVAGGIFAGITLKFPCRRLVGPIQGRAEAWSPSSSPP